jgi:hypothetical protein
VWGGCAASILQENGPDKKQALHCADKTDGDIEAAVIRIDKSGKYRRCGGCDDIANRPEYAESNRNDSAR